MEQVTKRIEELEMSVFMVQMKTHMTEEDFNRVDEMQKELKELKKMVH